MNPEILLNTAAIWLRTHPPTGVEAGYIDGFLARNRAALLEVVQSAFGDGVARFLEEHRLARLLLGAAQEPGDDGPEIASLLDGISKHARFEETVLFPFAQARGVDTGHVRDEHAFVDAWLAELARALHEGRLYEGPAFAGLRHHFTEEELLLAGLRGVPFGPPSPLLRQREAIEALAARRPPGIATPSGGRRSAEELTFAAMKLGDRVVTTEGQHGAISQLDRIIVRGWGGDDDVHPIIVVRLDSGRETRPSGALYAELRRGEPPPDDVYFDGRTGLSPDAAWRTLREVHGRIRNATEREQSARKADMRAKWRREQALARVELEAKLRVFRAWRARNPDVPVRGLDPVSWRRFELESSPENTPAELRELAILRRVHEGWATRFSVGDRVQVQEPDAVSAGWTIAEIDGFEAVLQRDQETQRAAMWLLSCDAAEATADGCVELEIDMPGLGRVRVVCGQAGRRDVWHNLWIGPTRYGFNGERWARGARPPDAVIAAVRARGVTVFK